MGPMLLAYPGPVYSSPGNARGRASERHGPVTILKCRSGRPPLPHLWLLTRICAF